MWLNERILKESTSAKAESGKVTIGGSQLETISSEQNRNVSVYAPYGFTSSVPVGEDMLIVPMDNTSAAVGTKSSSKNLKSGEVMLKASSGAYIYLRSDGCVVINSLVINQNGEIVK